MIEPTAHEVAAAPAAVLEFRQVRFDLGDGRPGAPGPIDFTVWPGDVLLVWSAAGADRLPLADAAQGLVAPAEGVVRYRGREWPALGARAAERRRGEIGRVFDRTPWVSNLDVEENVMLRLLHHGGGSRRQAAVRVRETVRAFGMSALPQRRPVAVPAADLQVAQWVRAFAGKPALILLEHPVNATGLPVNRLAEAVGAARARGGAVVWITARRDIWDREDLLPSCRLADEGATLVTADEDP